MSNPFAETHNNSEMRSYPVRSGAFPSFEGPPVPPDSTKPNFKSTIPPTPPPKSPWRSQFLANTERQEVNDTDDFNFSHKPYSVINDEQYYQPYNINDGHDDGHNINDTTQKTAVYDHYYNINTNSHQEPQTLNSSSSPELNQAPYGTDEIQPITQQEKKSHSLGSGRHRKRPTRRFFAQYTWANFPYLTYLFSAIQIIVLIVELAKMGIYTGSPFQTQPYFNPMIGPSTYLLVNMGARYVPCMQALPGISNDTTILYPCANSTNIDSFTCSLSQFCGLNGIPIVNNEYKPNQWYRVIIPIFMHAGIIHILFNLLLQILMGSIIELNIGSLRYFIIYFMSGILGFLLGANFAPDGIASTGALGALFGILAINMILFIWAGKRNNNIYNTNHYTTFILMMVVEIVVSFVLGLLPGLDNFSHIGGFAQGFALSIALLDDPFFVFIDGKIPKRSTSRWYKDLSSKIKWRFYTWCIIRVIFLTLGIVFMVMLIHNFFGLNHNYTNNGCGWCKYINCLPVNGWCDQGQISVTTTTTPNNKRDLFSAFYDGGYAQSGQFMGIGFYTVIGILGASFWIKFKRR
ncbi:uncharacterized protein KQ657_001337 [Scheffersomyces spartinae]|uniref:Rhomboid-type serine protease n=1 Tax=Scheffersomyces spartinae TaxID=45513 RepID=A0A9P8AH26_9ASCO|nr:uncharacterized protein KQ657_001337 [Scheffersomyces spartinae]KAG7192880.1 hypothetical protein KQ657_001337 [Scheffersomyces spartinae]